MITASRQNGLKRHYEDSTDAVREPCEPKRRQKFQLGETVQRIGLKDEFHLTHQEVLLLHAPKQRYQHTERHQIPLPKNEREMLVKVQAIGLNPIDWKAPDFGWGLPSLPCIGGRDLAGAVAKTSKRASRFRLGDVVMAVSTDYRDSRKAAYQEYAIVLEHNACRLPRTLTPTRAAPLGVAYVAAALSLGICLGVDFSQIDGRARGPDLLKIMRSLDPENFPKDIRTECLEGIDMDDRPRKGDWVVIWGGSSATGCIAIQLAKLAGLRVISVLDQARNGARVLKLGADLLVDRMDTGRAIEIIQSITNGKLRYGIDTRSKESAALLSQALHSPSRPESESVHAVCLTGLPKERTPGVVYHTVPIKVFHEVAEVGEGLMVWLEKLLETGLLLPPDIEVAEGGLKGINAALDRLRDGSVNGPRIVVPLQP
ncbi:hypothetical protein AJ80_00439 [Polytolypa hystricis UAMH7299]|uniref:Enoyl reductase (ER) domain-containing protein n=1 Tax=Polytolypa hystricis (strain UAMH7299) TaxID=1447883 RepID=A0A2B7Z3S0_POLH7|nr:hypothetical protein AJ80_00439 [Polytolypa hystricis UAMH7299]